MPIKTKHIGKDVRWLKSRQSCSMLRGRNNAEKNEPKAKLREGEFTLYEADWVTRMLG